MPNITTLPAGGQGGVIQPQTVGPMNDPRLSMGQAPGYGGMSGGADLMGLIKALRQAKALKDATGVTKAQSLAIVNTANQGNTPNIPSVAQLTQGLKVPSALPGPGGFGDGTG